MSAHYIQSRDSWKTAFILAACVHFCGVVFYAIFASGELQSWAEPSADEITAWAATDELNAQKKLSIAPAVPPPPRPAVPPPPGAAAPTSTNPFLNYGDPAPSYVSTAAHNLVFPQNFIFYIFRAT
jgi:hypothetical protein